jgi:outer membrane protein assembly factor BamB
LIQLATAGSTSESLALPGVLASRPTPLGDRWLIPLAEGPLFLLDPSGAQPPSAPLLPALDPATPARWLSPVTLPGGGAVVASTSGRVLRVAVSGEGQLTVAAEGSIAVPVIADPVVAEDTIWLATRNGDLAALTLPDLTPGRTVPLAGAPAWGPRAIAGNALVATPDGRLLSLRGAPTPTREVSLPHGPIVGAVAVPDGPIVLATRSGTLYTVAADTGQKVGAAVEVGQRLAGDPVVAGDRLLIVMADGSLHASTQPLSTLFLASASTAARAQPRD